MVVIDGRQTCRALPLPASVVFSVYLPDDTGGKDDNAEYSNEHENHLSEVFGGVSHHLISCWAEISQVQAPGCPS